jgi:hypothetical protein
MTSDKSVDSAQRLDALLARIPQPQILASNQPVSGVGAVSISGMTWNVVPGQYEIHGMVNWSQGASAVAQANGFGGSCSISSCRVSNNWQVATQFVQAGINTREFSGAALGLGNTPAYAAGTAVEWLFSGSFTVSVAGTLNVAVATTGGGSYTVGADSVATLTMVG